MYNHSTIKKKRNSPVTIPQKIFNKKGQCIKKEYREKYGFDKYSDVYEKKRIYPIQKGYVYRITPKQLDYYRRKNV